MPSPKALPAAATALGKKPKGTDDVQLICDTDINDANPEDYGYSRDSNSERVSVACLSEQGRRIIRELKDEEYRLKLSKYACMEVAIKPK